MADIPIDHFDVSPYPKGRFQEGVFWGERCVECATTDVAALLSYFDAYPFNFWPYSAGFGGWSVDAVCVQARLGPKPKSKVTSNTKPFIQHDRSWIYLTYTTGSMKYVGGRYVQEEFSPGLRTMTFPRVDSLLWASDDTPIMPGHAHVVGYSPAGEYHLSQFKLAVAPPMMGPLMGCVNNSAFVTLTLGLTFAAGTLLYAGAHISRGSPGALTSDWKQAKHRFLYNALGWNKVPRPETSTMEDVLLPTGAPFKMQTEANLYGVLV